MIFSVPTSAMIHCFDTFGRPLPPFRLWLINIEFTRQTTFLNSLFENLLVTFKANFEHIMTKVSEKSRQKKSFWSEWGGEINWKRFRMLYLQNTESKRKDMKSIVLFWIAFICPPDSSPLFNFPFRMLASVELDDSFVAETRSQINAELFLTIKASPIFRTQKNAFAHRIDIIMFVSLLFSMLLSQKPLKSGKKMKT